MKHTVYMHNARSLLAYNPESGLFKWKESRGRAGKGSFAGSARDDGYIVITINGRHKFAHRLAWMLFHGEMPAGEIDHIDGDRGNNKIANLRDVPRSINQQNRRRAQRNNSCGLLGVDLRRQGKPFGAHIKLNGKTRNLGSFDTAEEAHAAYLTAKRLAHPGGTL